jgi:hypothetical protein
MSSDGSASIRRGTIRRCCKKRLQKVTRRTCIRKQLVRQLNLERPIDSQHQLGAAQAVEPQIPVKIAIEGDSDPALHMGMQLPNQVPHEAIEPSSNLGTGFLWTASS